MVLIEPPPLLESVAGRKYHYPPAFHRLLWLLSKGLRFTFPALCRRSPMYLSPAFPFVRGLGVYPMRLPRFYTGRRINVFPMLLFCCQDSQGFGSLLFPFHLVADENTLFMRLKIDFLKFQQFYQLRGIYSTDFLVKLTKFHFECTRQICTL